MMQKILDIDNAILDGVSHPYVPPRQLNIEGGLKLHTAAEMNIDPVTYEVIRHNLWNINEEHGSAIRRISGSPVAKYAIDLNPSILTEDGEFVYFGPFMQYMSGVTDTQVKWILEYRSGNPGIKDGDMFVANDPWVGAAHQPDVMFIQPVFHGDELFCWVTNCLHQYDIGGMTPGGFSVSARDVYDEGILIPPAKIMENHEIREDVAAIYLRAGRRPDMVELDMRAQMAGNRIAADRIRHLIARYGPKVVKGVMKKILDNGEKAFLAKMATLPDGEWRERTYVECAYIGDRKIYPVYTTVRKKGTELTFENEGTAPQTTAMNCTYSGWRGSIMVVLNQLLCWEQYFAVGGALRHVTFNPTLGTFTCAKFPAAVSTSAIQAMEIALYPTYNVLSKMIYPNEALRPDIICMSGCSQMTTTLYRGTDQYGESYGYGIVDPIAGAIGAFAVGDGISTGGQSRTPISRIPNVEFTEYQFPVLYLYRREVQDSGGAGKFRGGLGGDSCFVTYGVDGITHEPIGSGVALPSSLGMMGGMPASPNAITMVRNSDLQSRMASGQMPDTLADLSGKFEYVPLRSPPFIQTVNDPLSLVWCGGGGFGDPLARDPLSVGKDVEDQSISQQVAESLYGAIFDTAGAIDVEKTNENRAKIKKARVPDKDRVSRDGHKVIDLTSTVMLRRDDHGTFTACSHCEHPLNDGAANFKLGAFQAEFAIDQVIPLQIAPKVYVDNKVVMRDYYCPGCGETLDRELVVDDDPPFHDVNVDLDALAC